MLPKSAEIVLARGLHKTYKHKHLLKFRLIFNIRNTTYCSICKFLSNLLIHQQKMSMLFRIPFLHPKRLEKYLDNYLKMVTDLSRLMQNLFSQVYIQVQLLTSY